MRGGDEQRPLRCDEAALDRARGFHQLGGEHHVDIARHRQQAEHGLAPRRARGRLRKQLDIIDRCAGALRDAGNRGCLREKAAMLREIDNPIRKHAAAFAAQRHDCDRDRPYPGDLPGDFPDELGVHPVAQPPAKLRSLRANRAPITALLTFCLSRSQRVGLVMTQAR